MTQLLANVGDVLRHRYVFFVLNLLVLKSVLENVHQRRCLLNYNLQFHVVATLIVFFRNLWCLLQLHLGFEPAHVCNVFILAAMCTVQNYLRNEIDVSLGGVLMLCVTGLLLHLSFNNPVENAIKRIADWTQFESKRMSLIGKLVEMQERYSAELESESSTGYPGMSDVDTTRVDNRSVTSEEECSTKDQSTQVDVSCVSKGSQYLQESSVVGVTEPEASGRAGRSSCATGGTQNWILLNFADGALGSRMLTKDTQKSAGDFTYPKKTNELCQQPANNIFVAQTSFKDPDIVNIEDLMNKSKSLIVPNLKRVSSGVVGAIETIYLRPWSWSEVNSECRVRNRK